MAGVIHLVRHAQASLYGAEYDALSEVGRQQAALLGEHLARTSSTRIFTGSLERQRHTGGAIRDAFARAGRNVELDELPGLNEFDPQIWRGFAAEIRNEDPDFAELIGQYKARRQERHPGAAALYADVTKRILTEWLGGRRPANGAGFEDFSGAVRGAIQALQECGQSEVIAVTSTTPIALVICECLGFAPLEAGRFMKWTYNASISTFRAENGRPLELCSWNATPHLEESVRTLV